MADTKELEVFDKKRKCKKCDSDLVTVTHNPQMELMVRKCSECGFEWFELPLDRKSHV